MKRYCESCRSFHDENEFCPKYKKQLEEHPEWFNEMVQTMATSSVVSPTVQKYGTAVKQHLVAYSGVDNQTGQQLTRSLKSISQQKSNPNYEKQILRQRAGFAAEVQETARANAERAINGEPGRVARYDDVGQTNHQLYDIIEIDGNGNIIDGTGSQMKFIGGNADSCWSKVKSSSCSKYVDSNTPIKVPKDWYDDMIKCADNEIKALENQRQSLLSKGETTKAESIKQHIEYCEKTKGLLQKSKVTSKESIEAVKNPEKYTAKEIAKNANQAGIDAAYKGALIGGGISIIRNVVKLKNGDIKADVAIKNIVVDTAQGAAGGYIVGAGGAALSGAMQNSSSKAIQALTETQFPGAAVGLVYGITKSTLTNFMRYKNGEISKSQFGKAVTKDAVKGGLVTCSMAMIAFPPSAVGIAAGIGVAMYLDAVCTNMLEEVFGEGLYGQILKASGHITATAQNAVELLEDLKNNAKAIEILNKESDTILNNMKKTESNIRKNIAKVSKMMEEC